MSISLFDKFSVNLVLFGLKLPQNNPKIIIICTVPLPLEQIKLYFFVLLTSFKPHTTHYIEHILEELVFF